MTEPTNPSTDEQDFSSLTPPELLAVRTPAVDEAKATYVSSGIILTALARLLNLQSLREFDGQVVFDEYTTEKGKTATINGRITPAAGDGTTISFTLAVSV